MSKYKRTAEWVWYKNDTTAKCREDLILAAQNRYVYFRKSFELQGDVKESLVDVSADGRYILYVNGERVGRGPARCSPEWQSYDTYNITQLLKPGKNTIATLVHSYGKDTSWYELPRWEAGEAFGCGGFFLQGKVITTSGEITLDTGISWKALLSEAWKQNTVNGRVGFTEELDARKAPQGWVFPNFNDHAWAEAYVLRSPGEWGSNDVIPFPVMTPRDIPFLFEEIHLPSTIPSINEVRNMTGSLEEAVSAEKLESLSTCRIENIKSLMKDNGDAVVTTSPGKSAVIILDYGRIQQGRVYLSVNGPEGSVIDIRFGERLAEDGSIFIPPWSYGGHHGSYVQTHRLILPGGPFEWEMFDFNGFQYVQATIRNCETPLHIFKIATNFTSYPVGNRGKFSCSDNLLNSIYDISAYTLQCCMLDSYEDCPSREQRQWTNDQYVHLNVNYAIFGDTHLARRLMMQVAQSQRADGQVMMCAPGDLSSSTAKNMSDFTLHWIMSFVPYVRYTGDAMILRELYPNIIRGINWAELHLNEDDLLDSVPGILWIDWAEIDKTGELTEINCRFVGCLRIAADIAEQLGIEYESTRCRALADRISNAINKILWDPTRGVYIDTRNKGVTSRRVSQQCNVAAMYFGVAPQDRWESILKYILDENRLVMTNAHGTYGTVPFDNEHDVVLAHAFYMHFLHIILAKVGRFDAILKNIRHWWGPQAKAGVSTWAEAFEPADSHTLCHAFMSTPGYDLPTYILGVQPMTDGFKRFSVAPQMGGLTWANGVFPSVAGDISVSWTLTSEEFQFVVDVPTGTVAELLLPDLPFLENVTCDGTHVSGVQFVVESGNHKLIARIKNK